MSPARDIARELLPYVVMLWATFALLGGALENAPDAGEDGYAGNGGGHATIESGVGLCALTVACVVGGAAARISRPRRVFELDRPQPVRRIVARKYLAYHRPPPSPPSLARLQILRT